MRHEDEVKLMFVVRSKMPGEVKLMFDELGHNIYGIILCFLSFDVVALQST